MSTQFLLDSGDPKEYQEISDLAHANKSLLWGSTTNPTLIAKHLAGKKVSMRESFSLQKKIVLEILSIVPGAVSAEVYADQTTKASDMINQGKEIASWHPRVTVKLPTTTEGLIARTELRKKGILTNNTLVFSQQQIYAICLHEQLVQKQFGPIVNTWPPFISPFVGRLDDKGENGMDLVRHGIYIKKDFQHDLWMLEASVRDTNHLKEGIDCAAELITAPGKIYREYFTSAQHTSRANSSPLKPIDRWVVPDDIRNITSLYDFMQAITSDTLNIQHELTEKGLVRFANDWKAIIR